MIVLLGTTQDSQARLAGFGNSAVETTNLQLPGPQNPSPQGILPGSLLTPVLRIDIVHEDVSNASGELIDTITELISVSLLFQNTRAKDISAIAIARELSEGLGTIRSAATGALQANTGDPGTGSDNLNKREGDINVPDPQTFSIYSPDEDPILAYVSMAEILRETSVSPETTSWQLRFNLLNSQGVEVPPFEANPFFSLGESPYHPADTVIGGPAVTPPNFGFGVVADDGRANSGTFYVLVATSTSLRHKSQIDVRLIGESGQRADPEQGYEFESPADAFLVLDYGFLMTRTVQAVCEVPEEEGGDDDDDDDGEVSMLCFIPEDYFTSIPDFPTIHSFPDRPRLIGVDSITDQVPLRKLNNIDIRATDGAEISIPSNAIRRSGQFRDNRVWSEFPKDAIPGQNRIWSQWPPGYPILSLAARSTTNASDYIVAPGRFHPDSGIVTGPLSSPEVLAGAVDYPWFGFDFAGGWPGGYSPRMDTMSVEVQGLGGVREIPGDGYDNDGDGLTDETGAEDNPDDIQLPGRNDDFDFFVELRTTGPNGGLGDFSGFPACPRPPGTPCQPALTPLEQQIAQTIGLLTIEGVIGLGDPIPGYTGSFLPGQEQPANLRRKGGIIPGIYTKGWDPVFSVIHVMDENRPGVVFADSAKFYRDVLTPGYDPSSRAAGLTLNFQPEFRIRLSELSPERAFYMTALLRIGALQSREYDEDGDGFTDEEADNGIDDDYDGLVDEDVNFVPIFMLVDEEIHNFWIDGPGGTANVYEPALDWTYIDYNNDGIYSDGRNDHITPNRDELVSGPPNAGNPLTTGASYFEAFIHPIDDDLDSEGHPGFPGFPVVAPDGLDNDSDGVVDEGYNEDTRDVVFGGLGNGELPFSYITRGFLFEDGGAPGSPAPAATDNTILDSVPQNTVVARGDETAPACLPGTYTGSYDHLFGQPMEIVLGQGVVTSISVNLNFVCQGRNFNGPAAGVPTLPAQIDEFGNFSAVFNNIRPGVDFQIAGSCDGLSLSGTWGIAITGETSQTCGFSGTWSAQFGTGTSGVDDYGDTPVTPFRPGVDTFLPPLTIYLMEDDPDRYLITYQFGDPVEQGSTFPGLPGPDIPNYYDGKNDFFLGFQLSPGMFPGADFQAAIYPDSVKFIHDSRNFDTPQVGQVGESVYFSERDFSYQAFGNSTRYPGLAAATRGPRTVAGRSMAYQVTKRQFAHVEISDMMGFTSPLEKDGGYRGRPYLEANGEPTAILGINLVDNAIGLSEQGTKLDTVQVNFIDAKIGGGVFDPRFDLKPLSNSIYRDPDNGKVFSESGVALYRDNKGAGNRGEFDPGDIPIRLALDSLEWRQSPNQPGVYSVRLRPATDTLPIPNSDFDEIPRRGFDQFDVNRGYDYFVVVRTSQEIDARDAFQAFIRPGDLRFNNGFNVAGSFCITHPYAANVPVGLTRDAADKFDERPPSGGAANMVEVVPGSDSIPVIGINMHDSNNTFDGASPARLSSVNVILEPAANRDVTLYTLPIAAQGAVTGQLSLKEPACGSGDSIAVTQAAMVTHSYTLDGFLSADSYEVNVWNIGNASLTARLVHIRGTARTPLAEGGPFGGLGLIQFVSSGVELEANPGDRIALEVDIAPTGTGGGYAFGNCAGDEGGSFVRLYHTRENVSLPFKNKESLPERLKAMAESGKLPKDPQELAKQIGGFTPNYLEPLSSEILYNIPLDPDEDNDNDSRTHALPDGLDNDGDGWVDEGFEIVNGTKVNSMNFDPLRYTLLSGIALFRDMPGSDTNGGFDDPLDPQVKVPDLPVFLSGEENYHFPFGTSSNVTLYLDHDPTVNNSPAATQGKGDPIDPAPFETIPANDTLLNAGPDYFLTIRTSRFLGQFNTFGVRFGVLFGSVNPEFPGDNLAVFNVPFGFMPGATTPPVQVTPYRQPYAYDPVRNYRSIPSGGPVAEEPFSPGSIHIPGRLDPLIQIETPFVLYESYKSLASLPIVGLEDGNSPPSLVFLSPTRFNEIQYSQEGLVPQTAEVHWTDLDQDDMGTTVSLVYFTVVDTTMGEIIPRTPQDVKPGGEPFDFRPIVGYFQRLNPGTDLGTLTPAPYTDILLSQDNENVNPITGLGNDVFTWDLSAVSDGRYRVAAILNDFDNPRILVVGGIVDVTNQRPVVILTRPVGDDYGTGN